MRGSKKEVNKEPTLAERIEALTAAVTQAADKAGDNHCEAKLRLKVFDLCFLGESRVTEDHYNQKVAVKERAYTKRIKRALLLYETMDQLRVLCAPVRGDGPGCIIQLRDFDRMKESEAFSSWNLAIRTINSAKPKGPKKRFSGLSLLSSDEQDLYKQARIYYSDEGNRKPTLQNLAALILGYTFKGAGRYYVRAVEGHRFKNQDVDRSRCISRVNSFGKTMRDATTRQMRDALTQAAVAFTHMAIPRESLILAALPEFNRITKEVREAGVRAMIAMTHSDIGGLVTHPNFTKMIADSLAPARIAAMLDVQKMIAQSLASVPDISSAVAALASNLPPLPRKRPRLKLLKSDRIM